MGKGDKKTKRGKIIIGSSGIKRARKKKSPLAAVAPKPAPKPLKEVEETAISSAKPAAKKPAKKAEEHAEATEDKLKASKTRKKSSEGDVEAEPAV